MSFSTGCYAPTCVSISQDGSHAAVGHDGYVSYIDLAGPTLLETMTVNNSVLKIALAENGYVYCSTPSNLISVNLDTKVIASLASTPLSKLYIEPGGQKLYATNSTYIFKLDITGGPAVFLYSSYSLNRHNYMTDGDIWLSGDRTKLFMRSGKMCINSAVTNTDLKLLGTMSEIQKVQYLEHCLLTNSLIAIPANLEGNVQGRDTQFWIYDYSSLAINKKINLPKFQNKGGEYSGHGRFVFSSSSGDRYHIIVQADQTSGLPLDFGVVSYDSNALSTSHTIRSAAGWGGTISPSGTVSVTDSDSIIFTFSPAPGFILKNVIVDGVSFPARTPFTLNYVTADHSIQAVFAPRPMDYYGMDLGNFLNYNLTGGVLRTLECKVDSIDESFFQYPTYLYMQEGNDGSLSIDFYQKVAEGLGLKRSGASTFTPPLIVLKPRMAPGNQWISQSTVSVNDAYGTAQLEASASKRQILVTPAGAFNALPITYKMTVTGTSGQVSQTWTEWFVPYIGIIQKKSPGSSALLTAFGSAGGSVSKAPPIITKVAGSGTSARTISGYNFGAQTGGSTVTIGGQPAQVTSWADKSIICSVPAGVTSGSIVVNNGFWNSNAVAGF